MNFVSDLGQFHFLRPALLWLILPAALACWALARTVFAAGGLQKLIDPNLLPHLLMRGGEKRPWLFTLIFALLTCAIIALAGPSWRKLPTPVYSNQDALVILLDLSPSMMATDLAPDRLTRARLKILDILKQRKDGLTALVAYAGEAHVVTPLTDDTDTIANLVPSLSPQIMPVPGSNIEMAVDTGLRLIRDGANGSGRLLAVTDGIDKAAIGTIKDSLSGSNVSLSILAVGSGDGSPIPKSNGSGFVTDDSGAIIITNFDRRELTRLARSTGGEFAQITVDDSDIARVLPENSTPEQAELTEREFDQWYEEGPWLVLLLLPFTLLLFRRGTLACALPLTLAMTAFSSNDASAADLENLWQTPNQQGRELLEQGDAAGAAKQFENSQWRGTAQYRAGKFDAAAKNFAQSNDPQGLYNLGNSLTQQGRFDEAISAFDQAIQQSPEFADAIHNREIAEQLKKLQQQQQSQSGQSGEQQQNDQQQDQNQQNQQGQQQDQQQNQQQGDESQQQSAGQNTQDQQPSNQEQSPSGQEEQEQSDSKQQQAQNGEQQEGNEQEQSAQAQPSDQESPLDPETQQALDQWLRQIPDDPAGLMREKFKYESLQRRRAYRSGEWQPPENGATQRW
ncbi:VWA domain-containing protein [Microbulbifer harenosus]|uniref:VWA domain-containing protein n=1 Tax=Microbulbifer harenosus TaxID=2576840 RepID=A0ABY2UQK0_9GAMM|nr:VWA domain-containing protein [Microbulbifer harenosus]TLM78648.1 VWA domain-containing protein [Microbulbifer harenosus]